jgi:hypothetical protein
MRVDPAPSLPSPMGPMPAATAAAAPPLDPPGVRSGFHGLRVTPEDRPVGLALDAEFRGGRLPDHDRPCGPQPCDQHVIPVRHVIGESDGAEGGAHSLRGEQVFDADRNPVQRP